MANPNFAESGGLSQPEENASAAGHELISRQDNCSGAGQSWSDDEGSATDGRWKTLTLDPIGQCRKNLAIGRKAPHVSLSLFTLSRDHVGRHRD